MKFDQICRAAEILGGHMERLVRACSLLVVDPRKFSDESGNFAQDMIDSFESGFRLPWPSTVVDSGDEAVMVARLGKCLEGVGSVGDGDPTGALNIDLSQRIGTESIGVLAGDAFSVAFTSKDVSGDDVTVFCPCVVAGESVGTKYRLGVKPDEIAIVNDKQRGFVMLWDLVRMGATTREEATFIGHHFRSGWMRAHGYIVDAMRPGNWIVSKAPSDARPNRSPKIHRSHQRRHYIVISDTERRRVFRESTAQDRQGDSQHVTPHARRAHYRHIGENEDGSRKYTWVRSCWVGSTEAEIRGQRYRVELDL